MRRLATPRWLLVHTLVAGLVVLMVNLGLWQLARLDEKRALNTAVAERSNADVVDLGSILPAGTRADTQLEWRRITAKGTWDAARAVTILNRSADGVAGTHSVVPLRLDDGRWLLVNRGFVPLTVDTPLPDGQVTVAGYLRPAEERGTLGTVDSLDPSTTEFQRLDIAVIGARLTGDGVPMWLQLADQSPRPTQDWPATIPLPEPDEGPHLSYAFQWFFFSAVAVAGWAVAMRRSLRTTTMSGHANAAPDEGVSSPASP